MDRKSILVLLASFVLLGVWFVVVPIIYPPVPKPPSTNTVAVVTNQLTPEMGTNQPTGAPPMLAQSTTNLGVSNLTAPLTRAQSAEQTVLIETPEAVYTFSSHGGGLESVKLVKYQENLGQGFRKAPTTNQLVELNARAEVPAFALRGGDIVVGDADFKLSKIAPTVVRAEKSLPGGLVLVKEFTVTNHYLVRARLGLENRSAQPIALPEHSWSVGTASSVNPQDDPTMLGAIWHNGVKAETVASTWFENRSFCMAGVPRLQYAAGAGDVRWLAVHNQFFAMALLPATNQVASQVLVRRLDLPILPAVHGKRPPPYGYEASLVYPAATLAAGQTLERDFLLYAGPKEYRTLSRLGHDLDVVMGYTGFFGWFAKGLLLSMNGLYAFVPSYGIVIVLITIIIKLLFWPLTQASTRSMKRMSALQPQMKAIQEKHKDDPQKMNKKLMEFMKENKVSPLGGCLPMLLQIPVFIGFYQMIRSAIELRGVRFLWAQDLSQPDTIAYLPGLDFPINPLPLIMGATMLWQARMTPATPGVDPVQQKIMKYMPMIFMVFLYNFSAGLTLYWTVQNLLTIAQMKLTKTQSGPAGSAPVAPAPAAPKKKKQA